MDQNKQKGFSTQCIETKYCGAAGLILLTVIWAVYVIVCLISVCLSYSSSTFQQAMSFSTFALTKVYEEQNYSLYNCPPTIQSYDDGLCTGVDLAEANVSSSFL